MTYSDFHYDYDERAHGSVWEVYNSRFAAMRAVAPEEVSHHAVPDGVVGGLYWLRQEGE